MSEMKRFDMTVIDHPYMEDARSESVIGEVDDGRYILHADHIVEIDRLQARLGGTEAAARLAYECNRAQVVSRDEMIADLSASLDWHRHHNDHQQARAGELEAVSESVRDDLLLRAELDPDGTRCVNLSASKWSALCDSLEANSPDAFIKHKQADAVEGLAREFIKEWPDHTGKFFWMIGSAMYIRVDADKAEAAGADT